MSQSDRLLPSVFALAIELLPATEYGAVDADVAVAGLSSVDGGEGSRTP